MTDRACPERRPWQPAPGGGHRSLPGFVFFAAVALLLAIAGMVPKSDALARQAALAFDQEEGQFGLLTVARQESGRVAHAPRPQAKPLLAAPGGGALLQPRVPVVLFSPIAGAVTPLDGPVISGDAHPPGQPRAPPAIPATA